MSKSRTSPAARLALSLVFSLALSPAADASIESIPALTAYLKKNDIRSVGAFAEAIARDRAASEVVFVRSSRSLQSTSENNPRALVALGAPGERAFSFGVSIGSTLDPSGRGETLEGMAVDESKPSRPIEFFTVEFPSPNALSGPGFVVDRGRDVQTLCVACHRNGFIWNSARFWPAAAHEISRAGETDDPLARAYLSKVRDSVLADRSAAAGARRRYLPLIDLVEARGFTGEGNLARFSTGHATSRFAEDLRADASLGKHLAAVVGALRDCDLSAFGLENGEGYATEITRAIDEVRSAHREQLENEFETSDRFRALDASTLDRAGADARFFPADRSQESRVAKLDWVLGRFSSLELRLYSVDFLKSTYELWEDDAAASGPLRLARSLASGTNLVGMTCEELAADSRARLLR